MAAKTDSQDATSRPVSNSELTCSVCLEQFKDPKVLPCCHTFCKQCLQPLSESPQEAAEAAESQAQKKSAALSCPKCRAKHEIPEGGVDGFLTDFSLVHDIEVAAVLKEKEKKPSCGQCESSDPSVAYCVQCKAFLCKFCSSAHERMKLCKEHSVLPLNRISVLQSSPIACDKHPQEDINVYCSTCRQLTCRVCVIEDHCSHTFQFVGEARQEYEENATKLIATAKEELEVYNSDLKRIKIIEELLQVRPGYLKKQVNENFDAYVAALESRRAVLLAEIDDEWQTDSKKVWAHKEFTETAIADITASLRFAERARSCHNSAKMIYLTKQAIQRLESLSKREHKLDDMHKVAVSTPVYHFSTHKEEELSTLTYVVRPKASLQLVAVSHCKKSFLGGELYNLRQQAILSVNMVDQPISMYRQLNVTPTVTITYGNKEKKSFRNFSVTKAGEGWTVTMDLVCLGSHTVSASLLGYSSQSMSIYVRGEFSEGDRVRSGPDWSEEVVDGEGTVMKASRYNVEVQWDDGKNGEYSIESRYRGCDTQYPIELVSITQH